MTYPQCSGCDCELMPWMEITMLKNADGSLSFYCPACEYAMKQEAVWQKANAERSE